MINSLEIEGVANTNLAAIKKHIVQYYKHILGEGLKYGSLDSTFWSPEDELISVEQDLLVQTFTEEEIRVALFDSSSTGALGPDGYSFLFYQYF